MLKRAFAGVRFSGLWERHLTVNKEHTLPLRPDNREQLVTSNYLQCTWRGLLGILETSASLVRSRSAQTPLWTPTTCAPNTLNLDTQSFQKSLIKEWAVNHVGLLLMVEGTFLH